MADIIHPPTHLISFDNPLVAIGNNANGSGCEFGFILKDGSKTNAPFCYKDVKIVKVEPEDSAIAKLVVNYDPDDFTTGIRLFTKENKCVL